MNSFLKINLLLLLLIGFQTAKLTAQDEDLDKSTLKNLPSDAKQILIINDILPLIKSTLHNEPLQKVFSEHMPGFFGTEIDLRDSWRSVEQNKGFIPDRIAVTAQDGAMQNIGEVYQFLLLMQLAQAAVSADEIETDLVKIHDMLHKLIDGFKMPNVTVLVHFRDKVALDKAFDTVQSFMTVQLGSLTDKDEVDLVSISGTVGDLYPEFVMRMLLEDLAMVDDGESAGSKRIAQSLAKIALKLQVDRVDGALRITLGEIPAKTGMQADSLGAMYQTGDSEIAFGKYDLSRLKSSLDECPKILKAFEGTKTAAAVEMVDTNDFQSSLDGMIRAVAAMNLQSAFRIHSGQSKVIVDFEGVGSPEYSPLETSPLLTFIPADSTFTWVTNVATLGRKFSDGVLYVENQIAQKALQDQLKGDTEKSLQKYEVLDRFVADFKEFRHDAHDLFPEQTRGGFAMLISNKGKCSLKMTSLEGKSLDITVDDAPIPELAFIGQAKDAEQMRNLLTKTYADVITGIGKVNDIKVDNELSVDVGELGLDVKTYELNADWLDPTLEKSNIKWEEFSGDCRSHFFFVDDFFVFSTSPRLSREMLDAKASGQHLKVQPDTVEIGRVSGETLGDTYRHPTQFASKLFAQIPGTRSMADVFDGLGAMVGGICSVMKETRWRTWQENDVTRTRYEMEFNN